MEKNRNWNKELKAQDSKEQENQMENNKHTENQTEHEIINTASK